MNWKKAKHIDDNKYELPGNWLKIEYFEALNLLFRIENSLRVFVYIILKNEHADKWKDLSITSDDRETSTIGAIAKRRLAQDKNYAYLGFVMTSPLIHLTSGELISIITSDSYWKYFKSYFLGSKDIIRTKLDEISNVRNALAHFRPIKPGDVELVKQNSLHTLTRIEETISDFILCPDIVPTNTEEKWYKELQGLSSSESKIEFRQSKDQQWIRLLLIFELPTLEISGDSKNYYYLRTANLISDSLLTLYPKLTKYVISASEEVPRAYTVAPEFEKLSKSLRLTFNRKSMNKDFSEIKLELERIMVNIKEEMALILEDNLARGKLIEVVSCFFEKHFSDNKYYSLDSAPFITELKENTPEEYWGTNGFSSKNYITDTEVFPWMPVDISSDLELPF